MACIIWVAFRTRCIGLGLLLFSRALLKGQNCFCQPANVPLYATKQHNNSQHLHAKVRSSLQETITTVYALQVLRVPYYKTASNILIHIWHARHMTFQRTFTTTHLFTIRYYASPTIKLHQWYWSIYYMHAIWIQRPSQQHICLLSGTTRPLPCTSLLWKVIKKQWWMRMSVSIVDRAVQWHRHSILHRNYGMVDVPSVKMSELNNAMHLWRRFSLLCCLYLLCTRWIWPNLREEKTELAYIYWGHWTTYWPVCAILIALINGTACNCCQNNSPFFGSLPCSMSVC
jgi:hypothetical protein